MKFKTGQAIELAGISTDAFRHWKTVLAPLRSHDGRRATLTLSDVVALAVIDRAVHKMDVPVSRLGEWAPAIFDGVDAYIKAPKRPHLMFVGQMEVTFGPPTDLPECDVFVAVRVDQITDAITKRLTEGPASSQLDLF